MKKICTVVLMVALLGVVIPAFGAIQAFKLGSIGQNSIDNVKLMVSSATSENNYMTFESPVGTDYSVPAGYTLYMSKIVIRSAAGGGYYLGYGDNGVANGVAAPTNWVQLTGSYSVANYGEFDTFIAIPTGKYPCAKAAHVYGVSVTAIGVEIAN